MYPIAPSPGNPGRGPGSSLCNVRKDPRPTLSRINGRGGRDGLCDSTASSCTQDVTFRVLDHLGITYSRLAVHERRQFGDVREGFL
jgi:hypothetical protein